MYFGGRRPLEVTCRHPGRLRDDLLMIFDGFGPPFRGYFGACFVKWTFFNLCLEAYFRAPKKERKRSSLRGGGHAIRSRRRMFRECRALSRRLHFGLHFGAILESFWGPSSLLYSFLVARVAKTALKKRGDKTVKKKKKTDLTEALGYGVWAPLKHSSRQPRSRD